MESYFAIFLGVVNGAILLPLSFYVGVLVRSRLEHRRSNNRFLMSLYSVAPLVAMLAFLCVTLLMAGPLLSAVYDTSESRKMSGIVWRKSLYFGFLLFMLTSVIVSKIKKGKK